ncbi:hypothetical protein D3C85_1895120 [compost metagenome]
MFEIPSGCVVPPVSISGLPVVVPLLIGTPSTTYNGWLLPLRDLLPLKVILDELPTPFEVVE